MDNVAQGSATRTHKHRVALRFGAKVPVFPSKADKTPYPKNGFKDATTDSSRINALWNRFPNANPAMPTGEVSGVFVLDVDQDKWGFGSLEALEEKYGELPATYIVKTGGGGLHYYFRLPPDVEIRNSVDKLGRGLDVRAEGGYVLLPGSVTEGTYEVLESHPIADAPAWLVELVRKPTQPVRRRTPSGVAGAIPSADGPPILEGARDNTLTSIAGRLHDGTRAITDLEADLMEINERRCTPPLPEQQVRKIARSIHKRTPCRPAGGGASAETLEALDAVEAAMWAHEWRGMGGKSERDALIEALKLARRHGEVISSGGVRVEISVRTWALATAVSKRAMLDHRKKGQRKPGIISRLKHKGFVRTERGTKSGAIILLVPRAEFHHSNHRGCYRATDGASGETLRSPFSAPRLRWSSPGRKPELGLVRGTRRVRHGVRTPPQASLQRLGKSAGAIVDTLEALGGELELADLYGRLYPEKSPEDRKRWRPRDLRRRVIARLEDAGVVSVSEDVISLTLEWLEALNVDRERGGELEAHRRDIRDYNDQSKAWRNRHKIKAERAPTEDEMQAGRSQHDRREAIEAAIVRLFADRPEYRLRRVGQITCALVMGYIGPDFPRGSIGAPRDSEVEAILDGEVAA